MPGPADAPRPIVRPVVVVGALNLDRTVLAERLPAPGETVAGSDVHAGPGGKGANVARAAARAGAVTALIGAVGEDDAATDLLGALSADGVDTTAVRRVPGPTGTAVITVDPEGGNTIVVVPGANGRWTLTDGDHAAVRSAGALVGQLEVDPALVTAAAGWAGAAGVPVLLNPSPVRALPAELWAAVSVLVVNEGEADLLARTPGGADGLARVPHLVTTLGAAGARYRGPGGVTLRVGAPRVATVDTVGAGDAFTGVLAAALAAGWPGEDPEPALRRACAAGALATTRPGVQPPDAAEVDALLARIG